MNNIDFITPLEKYFYSVLSGMLQSDLKNIITQLDNNHIWFDYRDIDQAIINSMNTGDPNHKRTK